MSSSIEPEYRLRNLARRLRDLLMSRRLSADPERTGIVELADFGRRCDELGRFAGESATELRPRSRSAADAAEEVELAARLAALQETLPKSPARIERQCGVLEEAARAVDATLEAECQLEEPATLTSLATLAREERKLFESFVDFTGRVEEGAPGRAVRGPIRRALRRALLDHEGPAPFELSVTRDGVLRFGGQEHAVEPTGGGFARSPHEPPEVKRALDLHEAAPDPALKEFLVVKAVDEALHALLAPRLASPELLSRARALPRRPGKRMAVRPEAVQCAAEGWDANEAARCVEKAAARRLGPEWARLPRGAYPLRLFWSTDDGLAADLLALGTALRRMEKGEAVAGTGPRAERALRGLLGLLG